MRTATDVISRLMWDESLAKDEFIVGYLDRFKGVLEQPFTSLDWSDPAIVDNFTLALPKHRIQYFKYKNKKVWDKNQKLDIVFGSTGHNLSIHDVMKQTDEDELKFYEEDFNLSNEDEAEKDEDPDLYKSSDRPNFFIATRIVDENICQNLGEVTEHVKILDSDLDECCIKNEEFHMTLATVRLDSAEDISKAVEALEELQSKNLTPPTITLESLDMFRNRVSYACVKHNDSLLKLRNALIESLASRKIPTADRFSFVPHVTVVKLSRPVARLKHTKFLDQNLFSSFESKEFGSQVVKSLCLSEIAASRRKDGFYLCAAEIELA